MYTGTMEYTPPTNINHQDNVHKGF